MRRTEDHRCIAAEDETHPGSTGALSWGHRDIVGMKGDCHDNTAAVGCGCHGSGGFQAEGLGQGLRGELSSGCFGMFGENRCLPRGGSSARTGYRLHGSKSRNR